jgi:DUF177 domain-containing protein
VPQRADTIDLETLHLKPGEGRRLDTRVRINPVALGGQRYSVGEDAVDTTLDVSRTVSGYALRLRFDAPMTGVCMRCMGDAGPVIGVDAREVDQPGDAEELHSPYVDAGLLDLAGWSRDALVLAMPSQIVCREECKGLCAICGADLNEADPEEHLHAETGDPRWAKLRDLKLG